MKKAYKLQNLGCANCARKMGEEISKLPGIESAKVNFALSKLTVNAEEEYMPAEEKLQEIIHSIEPYCNIE